MLNKLCLNRSDHNRHDILAPEESGKHLNMYMQISSTVLCKQICTYGYPERTGATPPRAWNNNTWSSCTCRTKQINSLLDNVHSSHRANIPTVFRGLIYQSEYRTSSTCDQNHQHTICLCMATLICIKKCPQAAKYGKQLPFKKHSSLLALTDSMELSRSIVRRDDKVKQKVAWPK